MNLEAGMQATSDSSSGGTSNSRPDPGAGLQPLDYLDHILERELRLTLKGVELGSERDDSMRELTETAATLYDGRIIRELIQNAYDGSGEHSRAEILVRLDLSAGTHGILDVANSGSGFTRDDVDSIANPARSRKRPGNAIGHKGLGFRSVTLISNDPQIYSSRTPGGRDGFDGFCFRFASQEDQLARLLQLGSAEDATLAAGKAHSLQLPFPIRTPPAEAAAYAENYATVIRLPLIDDAAASNMEAECQDLFDERAPLTLFLGHLAKLTIEKIDSDDRQLEVLRRMQPRLVDGIQQQPTGLVRGEPLLKPRVVADFERVLEMVGDVLDAQEEGVATVGEEPACGGADLGRLSGPGLREEHRPGLIGKLGPAEVVAPEQGGAHLSFVAGVGVRAQVVKRAVELYKFGEVGIGHAISLGLKPRQSQSIWAVIYS